MSFPTFHAEVQDYDAADLLDTAGGVGWQLDASRAAVLVHDMLPYYLQVLPEQVRHRVTGAAEAVVDWAIELEVPVLTSSPRPADRLAKRGLGGRLWGQGPSPYEAEQTAIAALQAGRETMRVQKRSYSAFYATDLAVELRRLGRQQLVVVGVFATGGVLATAYDALARDIELFVVIEATADYTVAKHRAALELIRSGIGQVVSLTETTVRDGHCSP